MPDELLVDLERVTDSLLERSSPANRCDLRELECEVKHREMLVRSLSTALRSLGPANYTHYNRLIIVRQKGEQIQANLLELRAQIAAELNRGVRDRLYFDRIAAQLPQTR